jgi:hypothetical protein
VAFSFITDPHLPSSFDGETIHYSINCLIYDKCMHRKIMRFRGETYLRQAEDGPSGACDMEAIKSRVAQYGEQYEDACDARTCVCWTMMASAIDFGLDFDDSCFVEDMTDSPTLADLAEECLCPLQDLIDMAGMSSMDEAAERASYRLASVSKPSVKFCIKVSHTMHLVGHQLTVGSP